MNRNQLTLLNTLGLFSMTAILFIGFILQFVLNELPCPLCLLQRVGFVMVAFGFMLNVVYGPQSRHYGVVLIGALYGIATSLRQVSLHVIPGTPGYGSPIFGMHYYTWAFVLFAITIFGVAVILLLTNKDESHESYNITHFGRIVCVFAIVVVALNVIATFVECGPYQCPDNPVSYWLFN
ncbi:inner (Transmembrane) protein [Photobacterium leiognathi lrivu.4.1]|uniref:Inner (Transmembrane) protein n=2 Tax=Photobacterium TaxID=657 RepID=V5F4L6_PHOLE|nr:MULTISPECIES: disulfide bond formation protein B [Photobacterium]EAS63337.1 hypothetical protein VAS14_16187 [Vibrio angustum S14] [Photobacterium angustum S14]GAD32580.1 inner (Transmembrane) protein [Photobacterium leiognathi lrivu.4.1]